MKKMIASIALGLFSVGVLAGTSNTAQLVKTTVLTNSDAEQFRAEFNGGMFPETPESKVKIACVGVLSACEITTYASTVTGLDAELLLGGRESVNFATLDGNFGIHCAQSANPNPPHNLESTCSFSQNNATLLG